MLAVALHCVSGETCVCIFRPPREKFRQVTANFLDAIASLQFSMSVRLSVRHTLLTCCPVTVTFNL